MTAQAIFETLASKTVLVIPVAVLVTLGILLVRHIALKRAAGRRRSTAQAYSMPVEEDDVGTIVGRIDAAKAADNKAVLADLYLAQALAHQKLGDEKARMAALTSAAGCASLYGPEATHAIARMQLAEAAYSTGDLTSACEHWHLAREAFRASGHAEEHARVEKLMRDNGCPTDWVLTEF
ncbi:hypothetical protein HYPDE_32258 [Hyphomicrobium denitrificans 1NES1]|uniref:Tetratricopeptide repeat protein n=1 Tax=Hyphomicrobium denitrificans 1NES1 TaxID=670307 RepID=N0BC85_9HYPH|nr:hypothetical protein [Hyphomicrobium denitrificans]AGK58126.1 hypothetical protein HYPDE_32258 [Hyphomicrobium denitrificans 1NES1]